MKGDWLAKIEQRAPILNDDPKDAEWKTEENQPWNEWIAYLFRNGLTHTHAFKMQVRIHGMKRLREIQAIWEKRHGRS